MSPVTEQSLALVLSAATDEDRLQVLISIVAELSKRVDGLAYELNKAHIVNPNPFGPPIPEMSRGNFKVAEVSNG